MSSVISRAIVDHITDDDFIMSYIENLLNERKKHGADVDSAANLQSVVDSCIDEAIGDLDIWALISEIKAPRVNRTVDTSIEQDDDIARPAFSPCEPTRTATIPGRRHKPLTPQSKSPKAKAYKEEVSVAAVSAISDDSPVGKPKQTISPDIQALSVSPSKGSLMGSPSAHKGDTSSTSFGSGSSHSPAKLIVSSLGSSPSRSDTSALSSPTSRSTHLGRSPGSNLENDDFDAVPERKKGGSSIRTSRAAAQQIVKETLPQSHRSVHTE